MRLVRAMQAHDLFLAGGGDILRDNGGIATFSYQVEKLILAVLIGKPVYLLNVGISRPRRSYSRFVLRWLLPRCAGIVARDHRTVDLCHEFGAGDVVTFAPDIVSGIAATFPTQAEKDNSVIVALHGDPNVYGGYLLTTARMRVLASSLDHLASLGYSIKFLACQRGEVDDHSTSQSIVRMMRYPANILPWTSEPQKIADAFGAAGLVVAMRLHAAVLAEAYGVPCVTMPYDAKVTEYSERAGHVMLPQDALDEKTEGAVTTIVLSTLREGQAGSPQHRKSTSEVRRTIDVSVDRLDMSA